MANAARGLALGGAAASFRAADQRAVQREGIQAQRDIAAGAQTGQNERAQLKIDEARRKSFVAESKAVVSGFIDQMNALTATLHPSLTQSQRAKVISKIETLERAIEQTASGLDAERGTGKARGANPVASLGDAASIRRQSFVARQAFVSAERKADAEGRAEATKLESRLGKPPSQQQKEQGAGVRVPRKDVNVVGPDGAVRIVNLNDPTARDTLGVGDRIVGLTVQATNIGGLTKGAATKVQTDEINLTNVTTELEGAQQLITKSTNAFGFMGVFNEDFLNKTVAQFAPDLFNRDVGVVRTFFRAMRETALRVASADDRFNKDDIERIGNLFPKDGLIESKPNALLKTQQLRLMFLNRLSLIRGKLGIENKTERLTGVQMAAAATLSFNDLRDATNKGQFTKGQFLQILEIFHNDVLQAAKQNQGSQ